MFWKYYSHLAGTFQRNNLMTEDRNYPVSLRWIAALIVGLSVIIAAYLLANAFKYKFRQEQSLSVTGAAEQNFVSDLIVWNASFAKNNFDLRSAFTALKEDEAKVRAYLGQMGLSPAEMVFSAVKTEKQFTTKYDGEGHETGNEFAGYQLTQTVKVQSKDIAKVDKISREVTGLIQQGVEMTSQPPSYFYTRLGTLKIDLLAKASEDGRRRAETIAKNAGSSLGRMKKATMGIFQITGQNENEDFSYGGAFNTSSIDKTATITVKMDFEID